MSTALKNLNRELAALGFYASVGDVSVDELTPKTVRTQEKLYCFPCTPEQFAEEMKAYEGRPNLEFDVVDENEYGDTYARFYVSWDTPETPEQFEARKQQTRTWKYTRWQNQYNTLLSQKEKLLRELGNEGEVEELKALAAKLGYEVAKK
jgi:hypothetical protein